jgi:hypothetical protein
MERRTIVDYYGAVGSAAAVCTLFDSMVALVRRVADVVRLWWSCGRRIATALYVCVDVVDAVHHAALMPTCVAGQGDG